MKRKYWPQQKKSLSQVFLREEWPIHKIVEKLADWKIRRVVEIGPGGGILTRGLVKAGFNIYAVEKDARFAEKLTDYFSEQNDSTSGNIKILNEDILKFDLNEWVQQSNEAAAVVGNVPYHISSPILMWLLPHMMKIKGAIIMVQLEFAERLAALPNTKSYGSLSVFAQLRANAEILCKVSRTCFHPVPNVDSAVVMLRPKPGLHDAETLKNVETITRQVFSQRRKKLRNSLKIFPQDRIDLLDIDLNRRAETLTPAEFVAMAEKIFK
jgi:16S rRNA (adenine1518-N6/adenine1519-N6)-dimethyltransferase